MAEMKRRPGMRWDGDLKNKTKDCDECKFKFDFHDREVCAWGVAFKYVVGEPTRKCEYFGKEPPKNNSFEYVLWAKQNNLLGRRKNYGKEGAQLRLWW